jgi:hypothetical protein
MLRTQLPEKQRMGEGEWKAIYLVVFLGKKTSLAVNEWSSANNISWSQITKEFLNPNSDNTHWKKPEVTNAKVARHGLIVIKKHTKVHPLPRRK